MQIETNNLMSAGKYCTRHGISYNRLYALFILDRIDFVIIDKIRFIDITKYPEPPIEKKA